MAIRNKTKFDKSFFQIQKKNPASKSHSFTEAEVKEGNFEDGIVFKNSKKNQNVFMSV